MGVVSWISTLRDNMGEPTSELAAKLSHISNVNDGTTTAVQKGHGNNVYMEFTEFTRKQIKDLEKKFNEFCSKEKIIGLTEMKVMMEKLGAPQTHLGLKGMISEVDEDADGALVFREFLLIFRKLCAGEFQGREVDGLSQLAKLVCGCGRDWSRRSKELLREQNKSR